ncbi:LLM class flavin-dependent oxidoreductase [Pseudonocardia sp. TRM90224]|uniref:LLM class flavin-dependent oxidoreductase n=1 Tax=Pseudonocardia sp. TRM90224 TaxID=2812678 RepID=UPI001E598E62|nr:LLM class flavin-dependent oxidoreductase [Pseudonocardia sp. TRM90224]
MRTGIVVAAHSGVSELAVQAEELGFNSFWVYDTPMVHGDPFVALSSCARATSRIKLGVGVTSPALRSAPAAASAFASLNALAPGRIVCGVGTGNTARRTLGSAPTTTAELEVFTAALQGLCAGRGTSYHEGDRDREIRFLHTGHQVNTADPIEFVVAAQGPKAAAVAGRRDAGLMSFGLLDPVAWRALHAARQGASDISGAGGSYLVTALHVLHEGEDPHGDAARDAVGHVVLALLAYAAEIPSVAAGLGAEERAALHRLLDRRGTTATAPDRHTMLYSNYLGPITPADRDLITPTLMHALTLVGTPDDLRARLAALAGAGVDELLIQPVVDPLEEMAVIAELIHRRELG